MINSIALIITITFEYTLKIESMTGCLVFSSVWGLSILTCFSLGMSRDS